MSQPDFDIMTDAELAAYQYSHREDPLGDEADLEDVEVEIAHPLSVSMSFRLPPEEASAIRVPPSGGDEPVRCRAFGGRSPGCRSGPCFDDTAAFVDLVEACFVAFYGSLDADSRVLKHTRLLLDP